MKNNIINLEAAKAKELAKILGAVAHENRICILNGLKEGDNLSKILTKTGISRSTLQNHLEMLNHAGLIERIGGKIPYKLTQEGIIILSKVEEIDKEIIEPRYNKKIKLEKGILEKIKKIEEPGVFSSALGVKELEELLTKLKERKK
jgi:predicted transcriptional regulator